jgi:integrase
MRPGEIMGLQVGDFREGVLHILRRVYRGRVDTPKGPRSGRLKPRSLRAVPPTDTTKAILDRWISILPNAEPDSWLFPSETGLTPLSYSNLYRRRIQPALAAIGLDKVNFQVLR